MSDRVFSTMFRVVISGLKASLVLGVASGAILGGTALAMMPGPVQVGSAAVQIAEALPLDLTRLALTVAVLAILANMVQTAIFLALVQRASAKPCLLNREDGLAVMGHAVERAAETLKKAREG